MYVTNFLCCKEDGPVTRWQLDLYSLTMQMNMDNSVGTSQQLKSTSGKIHVSHNRALEFAFKQTVRMSAAAGGRMYRTKQKTFI